MQTMPPKLIITRPEGTGSAFAKKVQAGCDYSVDVVLSPGLNIVPVSASITQPVDHVIFTSVNAVTQAKRVGVTPAAHAWCVGRRTMQSAVDHGFDATDGGGDAAQLFQTLLQVRPEGKIIHLAGTHTHFDIATALQEHGFDCSKTVVYDQQINPPPQQLCKVLGGRIPLIIPLFSARSGLMLIQARWSAPVHIVAMSAHIANAVVDWGADTIRTAVEPTEAAMVERTCATLDAIKLGPSVT